MLNMLGILGVKIWSKFFVWGFFFNLGVLLVSIFMLGLYFELLMLVYGLLLFDFFKFCVIVFFIDFVN